MTDAADRFAERTPRRDLVVLDRRRTDRRDAAADRRRDRAATAFAVATSRPHSGFIAQLIATSLHAPQTRVLRRAETDVATAAYRRKIGLGAPQPGSVRTTHKA